MFNRQIDTGSERAVLSGICQYGKNAYIDVSDLITINSFTVEGNQAIYKCLSELVEVGEIDIASLIAKAEELNLTYLINKKQEDLDFLRALFNFPIKLENVRTHAKKIAKLEVARKAIKKHLEACEQLNQLNGSESIDDILGVSEKPIFDLITEISAERESLPIRLGNKSTEYLEDVLNNPRENIGLPSPFPTWNYAVGGGFRRGGVSLWVTRPKGRKSTTAIITGLHLAKLGIPILYLDTEMVYEEQLPRILANLSGVDINKIETGKVSFSEKKQLYEANKVFVQLRFDHKSVAGKKFTDIIPIIRRWVTTEVGYSDGKLNDCLVIYDYFKIMNQSDLGDLQEYQAIGYQLSALADLTKIYDFPCLSFTQVNRDGIGKETSDIISQSDRFTWLSTSITLLKRKDEEEIVEEGRENGNMKIKIVDNMCRFGPGLDVGDHINIKLDGSIFRMTEVGTKFQASKSKSVDDNGFDTKNMEF